MAKLRAKLSTFKLGERHEVLLRDLKRKTGFSMTELVKRGIEAMHERQYEKEKEGKG